MLRTVLLELLLFLTPFAVYALLLWLTKGALVPEHWTPRALILLSIAALVLMAGGLYLFEGSTRAPPGARYVPAEVKDGKLVPGHFQ